jgi:hypothetical protein
MERATRTRVIVVMAWVYIALGIVMISALLLLSQFIHYAFGQSRDLTAEQARSVLASAGINPGTVRQIGDMGRFALRSVDVAHGRERGEFVVRIKIEALP